MKSFWEFAHERQAVWHRRFVRGLPSPWTDDAVIDRYRFTNVQRELDHGTAFLRAFVLPVAADEEDAVRRVLLYRALNNFRTWKAGGALDAGWFNRVRAAGLNPVFGSAWMATGFASYGEGLDGVEEASKTWSIRDIAGVAARESSLSEVHPAVVAGAGGFGQFTAFQVTLDLTYVFDNLSDDEWVWMNLALSDTQERPSRHNRRANVGGSAAGALLVRPDDVPFETAVWLRDNQDRQLAAAKLCWEDVAWAKKPRLTLADIEHALCEYVKYDRLARGIRTKFRRYRQEPDKKMRMF